MVSDYLKDRFGGRIAKVCVDGGFTCPNREDGRQGCLFCTDAGAGDFSGDRFESIRSQFLEGRRIMDRKWQNAGYIVYFQNFTNTYAHPKILEDKYAEALECPDVKGLAIATRPDCLGEEVMEVLKRFNGKTFLWLELGFQTADEETANLINRGYGNEVFDDALRKLKSAGIKTVAHLMAGLPGETKMDFLNSVEYVNRLMPWGVKFHCTYIQKNSPLYAYSLKTGYRPPGMGEYVDAVSDALLMIDKRMVVHRLTGDPDRNTVHEPLWACDKLRVLSMIWNSYRDKKAAGGE